MNTLKQIREIAERAKMGEEEVEFALLLSQEKPKWDYPDLLMEKVDD